MQPQDFKQSGYREHTVTGIESKWASVFLQKRIEDELGTKFFINIYFPCHSELSFQPTSRVQLNTKSGTLNMELFHFKDIDSMEVFYNKAFVDNAAYYYEGGPTPHATDAAPLRSAAPLM